ncbi:hypothetical protein [Planomonospora algeriensis]
MKRIYISQVDIPDAIEDKIRTKHNLTGAEVRAALIYGRDVVGHEQTHELYGTRVIVYAGTRNGQQFQAFLYPVDRAEGIYRLGTAILREM